MYVLGQLAFFLLLAFLLGVAVGYALWRMWGKRRLVARYSAAERRLAAYLAQFESADAATSFLDSPYQ